MVIDEGLAERQDGFYGHMARLGAGLIPIWRGAVNLITPPLCLICRESVQTGASLCIDCWSKLNFIDEPVCDALGTPFEYDEGPGALSGAAIAAPPPWDMARAAVAFDDASKPLVHALKYRDTFECGLAMERLMRLAGRKLIAEADVIVPVPLHRLRLWRRRFNQAAFLAQRIGVNAGKPVKTDLLQRQKRTRQQVGLTAEARQKNVRRAFAIAPERWPEVDGKTILLVDDVRTTGATAAACAETLKKAGAARVHVLTFALVLNPLRLHIEA